MPSWSGGACPSRLIAVGQSRFQALHSKGFPVFISGILLKATQFHKSPVLNDDCEVHLPQRVPVWVKTRGRNPDECPVNRNLLLLLGAISVKRLLGSVHPCPAKQESYLRGQNQRVREEVAGGIWKLSGAGTGGYEQIITSMYTLWARIADTGKISAHILEQPPSPTLVFRFQFRMRF